MVTTNNSDQMLLSRWADEGDEDAFRSLVDRYANLVQQAAYRRVGSRSAAEEASQQTFILLARRANKLRNRNSVGGWLLLTAMRQASNTSRSENREQVRRRRYSDHLDCHRASNSDEEMRHEIDEAMKHLGTDDRELILLRHYRGLAADQIGALFGISGSAARQRVSRALGRLRVIMQEKGFRHAAGAGAGAIAMFGVDASGASVSLVEGIATCAVKSSGAAPFAFLSKLVLIMQTKTTLITAGACLLLAVGGGVVLVQKAKENEAQEDKKIHPAARGAARAPGEAPPSDRGDGMQVAEGKKTGPRGFGPLRLDRDDFIKNATREDYHQLSYGELIRLDLDLDNPPDCFLVDGTQGGLHYLMGRAYYAKGHLEKALEALEPENFEKGPFHVVAAEDRKGIEEAIAKGNEAVRQLAEQRDYGHDFDVAISHLAETQSPEKKLRILKYWSERPMVPQNEAWANILYARELAKQGHKEDAIQAYDKAIAQGYGPNATRAKKERERLAGAAEESQGREEE